MDRSEIITTMLKSYDKAIEHYDFVINDLSGIIYNPDLEANKAPVISFLKEMRKAWEDSKAELERQI